MSYIFCESLVSRNAPFLHIVLYIWYKSSLLILLKCPIILFPTAGLYFICLSISSIRSRPPNASCSSRKQNPFTADNTPPSFIHLWVSRRVLRGVSVCNCKGSTAPRKRFQNWHVFQWLLLLCFLSGTMNLKFPAKRSNAKFSQIQRIIFKKHSKGMRPYLHATVSPSVSSSRSLHMASYTSSNSYRFVESSYTEKDTAKTVYIGAGKSNLSYRFYDKDKEVSQ